MTKEAWDWWFPVIRSITQSCQMFDDDEQIKPSTAVLYIKSRQNQPISANTMSSSPVAALQCSAVRCWLSRPLISVLAPVSSARTLATSPVYSTFKHATSTYNHIWCTTWLTGLSCMTRKGPLAVAMCSGYEPASSGRLAMSGYSERMVLKSGSPTRGWKHLLRRVKQINYETRLN